MLGVKHSQHACISLSLSLPLMCLHAAIDTVSPSFAPRPISLPCLTPTPCHKAQRPSPLSLVCVYPCAGLYWSFPIMYYAAIMGLCSMELLEPVWAALDWLIKMVYSSSLMETNFFVVQRRESVMRAVEEANKIKTIRELSTAIERKDDFLSAMSHELRTPLNGIIGLSESLELGSAGQMPDKAMQVGVVEVRGGRPEGRDDG